MLITRRASEADAAFVAAAVNYVRAGDDTETLRNAILGLCSEAEWVVLASDDRHGTAAVQAVAVTDLLAVLEVTSLLRRPNLGPSPCGDPTCQCPDPCDSMDCRCPE